MAQSPLEYVVAHWSKLIENFSTSSDEFYRAVGAALASREVPCVPDPVERGQGAFPEPGTSASC